MGLAEELRALAPFGRGNPRVSLLLAGASFADAADGGGQARALHASSPAARVRGPWPSGLRRAPAGGRRRARCRRPSRWRSTSGTGSASPVWCCAGRGPRERAARPSSAHPAGGRRRGPAGARAVRRLRRCARAIASIRVISSPNLRSWRSPRIHPPRPACRPARRACRRRGACRPRGRGEPPARRAPRT